MSEDMKKKLQEEILSINWQGLIPHLERGTLFLVTRPLSLVEVGVALAQDDAEKIKVWLQEQKLVKINKSNCEPYSACTEDTLEFLIVQPFVLFQESEKVVH